MSPLASTAAPSSAKASTQPSTPRRAVASEKSRSAFSSEARSSAGASFGGRSGDAAQADAASESATTAPRILGASRRPRDRVERIPIITSCWARRPWALALGHRESVSRDELERLRGEIAVGPAHRDLGLARRAEAEMQRQIVLRAVVAVAAADLLRLGDVARLDGDARADRRAVGAGAAGQRELRRSCRLARSRSRRSAPAGSGSTRCLGRSQRANEWPTTMSRSPSRSKSATALPWLR